MTAPLLHFARYRDIAADVAARLSTGAEDAIVASGGMATAITAAALTPGAAASPNESLPQAVSLELVTIEVFARKLVNDAGEYPRVASDEEQRLAMRSAARLAADRIIDSQALGAMLQRSYRDVRDAGLTLDEFEQHLGSMRSRRRAEAMLRAWRDYERLIADLGAVDPADVLLRAASLIESSNGKPQVVAGFYDMTGAQLRIVHALSKAGRLAAIFVPASDDDAFANHYVKQLPDCVLAPQSATLRIKIPASEIAQFETRAVELREVCKVVNKRIDEGASLASIAIVARSLTAHDIRLIHRFADESGFEVSAVETSPLFAHRIGRSVRALLRMRDRMFPRAGVMELLRDGFTISRQVNIDELDVSTRRANIAGGDSDSLRPRADEYADVVAELESFAPSSTLGGAAWGSLLDRILQRFKIETDADVDAAEAVGQIAAILRRAEAWHRRFDAATVVDLIEQVSLTVTPDRPSASVWAGDVMRFRGRTFDHVFVVRMEDEVFPQRRTEDPLLTDADRRAMGLREIGDGRDEERLLFQLLLDGASDSVHFSVAGSDGVGKLIRPSSLLRHFAIEKFPERRADILRNFAAVMASLLCEDRLQPVGIDRLKPVLTQKPRPVHTRQLQLIARSGSRSTFDGYLDVTPEIDARIRAALSSLSPTHLEDFGECPQKFLLKHILGVRDVDEPERELHVNPRDKGSLDHRILERFYRALSPRELDAAVAALPRLAPALRERLDGIIDDAFDDLDSRMPPFNRAMRDIERRSTKRHLQTFVAADLADLEASGLRPREFEYAFGPKFVRRGNAAHAEAFVYQAGPLTIPIEGQIDRIDGNAGKLRIIDYKSGKALRHLDLADKINRGVRMQLALYAMAVTEFFGMDASAISGAIKPLRGGNDSRYSFALADHIDELRRTIELFAGSMIGGTFPAFPADNDNDFNSCKYCPVNHSCRTKHNDAEAYAVTRHGDPKTLLKS